MLQNRDVQSAGRVIGTPRDLCTIGDIKEKQNLPLKGEICEFSEEYRRGTTPSGRGKS